MRRLLLGSHRSRSRARGLRARGPSCAHSHEACRGDRDHVRRQRPRLGTRCRHESVRGARLCQREGWTYDQILAHYYVGAELGPATVARVRVLVGEAKGAVKLRSKVPFRVRDVFGTTDPLAAGELVLGPKLWVTVNGAPTELAGPILFLPGAEPLDTTAPTGARSRSASRARS